MAAPRYKQEMPPQGGYGDIPWAKKLKPRGLSGKMKDKYLLHMHDIKGLLKYITV